MSDYLPHADDMETSIELLPRDPVFLPADEMMGAPTAADDLADATEILIEAALVSSCKCRAIDTALNALAKFRGVTL